MTFAVEWLCCYEMLSVYDTTLSHAGFMLAVTL